MTTLPTLTCDKATKSHQHRHLETYCGWASEILHQLIGGKHPILYSFQRSFIGFVYRISSTQPILQLNEDSVGFFHGINMPWDVFNPWFFKHPDAGWFHPLSIQH